MTQYQAIWIYLIFNIWRNNWLAVCVYMMARGHHFVLYSLNSTKHFPRILVKSSRNPVEFKRKPT